MMMNASARIWVLRTFQKVVVYVTKKETRASGPFKLGRSVLACFLSSGKNSSQKARKSPKSGVFRRKILENILSYLKKQQQQQQQKQTKKKSNFLTLW